MTPKELKNAILQLAISGKLVEQRPEEGTAAELYAQIQAEKRALIAAGKLKKEKPLPEIADDETPFDIPEGWMWCRLGDCSSYAQPKEKITADTITASVWSLDLEDIEKDTGRIVNFCCAGNRHITGDKVVFHEGQILYSKLRPYLKKILVAGADGICTPELVPFYVYGKVDAQYIVTVLKSPHIDYQINTVTYGVKMPRVGTETMTQLLIPLPPLAEQKRIVAKIEELLPLVDRYEQAWTRLEDLDARFPLDMQKALLQFAIQGKLVEQRPEEGTGEDLYKQIQAEKQTLIKSGKLKKEKPLPEIAEDEKPFDIPEGWKWCRLGNIGSWSAGATPLRTNPEYYNGKIPWLKTGDLNDSYISDVSESISELALEKNSVRLNPVGSVLIAMYGATIGKLGIAAIPLTTNQACCACIPFNGVYNEFLFYFLLAMRQTFIKMGAGGAQPNISKEKIVNTAFPLPPLPEQKRIVAKLQDILPLCGKMK